MKKTGFAVLFSLMALVSIASAAETYKIGVLAKNGPVKALQMWKATGEFLTAKIPGKTFEVVPLDFDAVYPAIEKGEVQFFIINSSMFITAKMKYGASAVATMINSRQGQPLNSFGGLIFTAAGNAAVNSIQDIKGKAFMAVEEDSFGGWQMAYKEILDAGIDPGKDFSKLQFGGKHENVVLAVQNGTVDCGTVRTDTLERMVAEGTVEMGEFKIVNPKSHKDFPFVCSTALYPEWPLAKTGMVPDAVGREVLEALKAMASAEKAAKDAKVVGWSDPLDYQPVEDLQKSLKLGAYAGS